MILNDESGKCKGKWLWHITAFVWTD